MFVLHDMKLMLIYYGPPFVLDVESQKGKELIVERLGHTHLFDGYLYVVNDRLHGISFDCGAIAALSHRLRVLAGGITQKIVRGWDLAIR